MAPSLRTEAGLHGHFLQFYEKDSFLVGEVSDFVEGGLRAGEACLVIATQPHREALERRLKARRASSGASFTLDQYIAVDAAETLSQLSVDGWPDKQRFAEVAGNLVRQVSQNGSRGVRAFGEMVALLWTDGKHDAAIRLEELWNDLLEVHPLSLLCAYPMEGFRDEEHGDPFAHICNAHSQVRPAESFLETASPDELRRQVALLQQKAAALETEVAKRRQTEQELAKRLEQLAEAGRRKDEFLAMLGHELRNPLAAIVNAVELMRLRGDDPAYTGRSREIVARQSTLMARLLDDLLDVSRVTRGKIELRAETVFLDAIIERAVEIVRPLIDERGHRLTLDLPAGPMPLTGDAARLSQVLANLLNNAAKYTDPGGHISLSARKDGTDLLISVRDDGVGMTADLRERIFEPFVQAPTSLERARGGLGIGLTLVRTLVHLHGGSIEAFSDGPGRGSEFAVRLPLASA